MPGLDPTIAVHKLDIKTRVKPVKQTQRLFCPELVPEIEKEFDKLLKANFIREVKYPSWIANIVPVKKKNGQIRVCVNFRDLNKACPKDDFPLPITELTVDATTGHEVLSFMDGSSGYNQIRMDPKDEEMTAFRTPKDVPRSHLRHPEAETLSACTLQKSDLSGRSPQIHHAQANAIQTVGQMGPPTESTPYSLVYGVEVVLSLEIQIPSL
ncbi:hypothetical protein H6P81_002208 [Aristolochia fimbriata]|uniref:Reverse transcriptase domain-containing protein n=1 Tax=Aristolochia fimbriata TaxID=158543 RepID=A0AAV7F956_ARIFI|nr:hypothetical protein H6P81_002208 [Aristolochia fimbriata]